MISCLDRDADREAVHGAVADYCRRECSDARLRAAVGRLDADLWHGIAALGVLAIAAPGAEAGALELVAAFEALGEAAFPGPLVETVIALRLLPAEERSAVAAGRSIAAVGRPPLLAWAPEARLFLGLDERGAWLGRPAAAIEPHATLGGDPWGRTDLVPERALEGVAGALAWGRTAASAYLAAAGSRLIDAASEHARTRRQFGRPIGEFQAVAHPLADAAIHTDASRMLARLAAAELDAGAAGAEASAAAAWLSARASALRAVHTAHQVFGAVGITVEGPAFPISRRIRHLASLPVLAGPGARELLLAERGLGGDERTGASP